MGNCMKKKKEPPLTLAILGLDNAGKTVTTKGLQGESLDSVAPTIGFTSVDFQFNNHDIVMFDLGGGKNIRNIWKNYFAEIYGLVYVVDSSAQSRVDECNSVLLNLLQHPQIQGKPLLLLANKQDVSGAMDEIDICEYLGLEELVNKYKTPCRVEPCSAILGQGKKLDKSIRNGMAWLTAMISKDWVELKKRVDADMAEMKAKESKEKKERAERVRKVREERDRQEKEERLARGEAEKPESDDEGIGEGGGPFKRVSRTELENKEKQMKEEKRLKKEQDKNVRKSKSDTLYSNKQTRHSIDSEGALRGSYSNQNENKYSGEEEGYESDILPVPSQKSIHSLPPLDGGSELYSSPSRSRAMVGARLGQYDSPRPNRRFLKNGGTQHIASEGSDEETNKDLKTSSSLDRGPWLAKKSSGKHMDDLGYRSGLAAPLGRSYNTDDIDMLQLRKGTLSPLGPLQPLEELEKKKKKKKKARKNQTAPDIISPMGDDGSDHSWPVPPAPRASRSPRLDTVQDQSESESDHGATNFSQKYNLIDELPEMQSHHPYHGSRRGPNTDYDEDIVT